MSMHNTMSQIVPEVSRDLPVWQYLDALYRRHLPNTGGTLASYIPELAAVSPDQFSIAFATTDGFVYEVGDAGALFTIQSISKAIIYGLALEDNGAEAVLKKIGVEPSGEAFNSIVFDERNNRPFNPMVNAGAITIAGVLHQIAGAKAFDTMQARLSAAAGRPLVIDEAVYRSEVETGHRNRAIGHILKNVGVLRGNVDEIVDLYFRQCSLRVTAEDLARMGATLANVGENPQTGETVFDIAAVRNTLAVMFTCGMYDHSGNWAVSVGIPAKSGVGGGVVGVVNRQLGISTFSPRVDEKGNSIRGLAAFAELSDELGLHAFDASNLGSAIAHTYL